MEPTAFLKKKNNNNFFFKKAKKAVRNSYLYEISQMKNIPWDRKQELPRTPAVFLGITLRDGLYPNLTLILPLDSSGVEFPGNSNVLGRQTCTGIFQEYQQNLICFLYVQRTERVIKQKPFALPSFTGVKSGFLPSSAFNILLNFGIAITYPTLISLGIVLSVPVNAGKNF